MSPSNTDRCPCGTGETYGACCGKIHAVFDAEQKVSAPTPEALMRSRFTAFATGNVPYLLASWHPSTRPDSLDLDGSLRWYRLDILDSTGGVFDTIGTVKFATYYRSAPGIDPKRRVKGVQQENSRFEKLNGQWLYLDGEVK